MTPNEKRCPKDRGARTAARPEWMQRLSRLAVRRDRDRAELDAAALHRERAALRARSSQMLPWTVTFAWTEEADSEREGVHRHQLRLEVIDVDPARFPRRGSAVASDRCV